MTGPHPDDVAHVRAVTAELRGLRCRQFLSVADVAAAVGVVDLAEFERGTAAPRVRAVQAYADAVGHRAVIAVTGVPAGDLATVDTLTRAAAQAGDRDRRWEYERAAVGARLAAAREAAGLTQVGVAGLLGVSKSAVSQTERVVADDPMLYPFQAYARALGGMLRVRVVPAGQGVADRLGVLLDELRTYGTAAVRWRVVTPDGVLKGISEVDARRIADETGGTVDWAEVFLLPGGTEVLGPWTRV